MRELREHLLPGQFSPTGNYSPRQLTRTIAYRVLVHAEIESYLEDRVSDIAKEALRKWNSNKVATTTLLALIAFSDREMRSPPASIQPPQPTQSQKWNELLYLQEKANLASKAFFLTVKNNHGLREANILSLFLPIGVDPNALSPNWLANMDSFGALRGEAAHKSSQNICIQQAPDPQNEYNLIQQLIVEIRSVDQMLSTLT